MTPRSSHEEKGSTSPSLAKAIGDDGSVGGRTSCSGAVRKSPLCLRALNHISRICQDVEVTRQFYMDVLGFQLVRCPLCLDGRAQWAWFDWIPQCSRGSTSRSLPPQVKRPAELRFDGCWLYSKALNIGIHLIKVRRECSPVRPSNAEPLFLASSCPGQPAEAIDGANRHQPEGRPPVFCRGQRRGRGGRAARAGHPVQEAGGPPKSALCSNRETGFWPPAHLPCPAGLSGTGLPCCCARVRIGPNRTDEHARTQIIVEEGVRVCQLFMHDPDSNMIEVCNCNELEASKAGRLGS